MTKPTKAQAAFSLQGPKRYNPQAERGTGDTAAQLRARFSVPAVKGYERCQATLCDRRGAFHIGDGRYCYVHSGVG